MSELGMLILEVNRRHQPMDELERKWKKAQGRHSNAYWCIELLDLANAEARELWKKFKSLPLAEERR